MKLGNYAFSGKSSRNKFGHDPTRSSNGRPKRNCEKELCSIVWLGLYFSFLTCMQYGVYKDLHEKKVLHVFLIKWVYCLWYTYERLVMPWNHFFVWASIRRLYVFCFKIAYHLSFQVTMAANKTQNVWNILTKVSDKVCWSGWTLYKVCKETFNSHFHRTAEGQIKKRKIPTIKRKKGIGVKLVDKDS